MEILDDEFFDHAEPLFTVTQGALQAAFSCRARQCRGISCIPLGSNAAESVVEGWLGTFNAVYEQEATGITMWVSLRVAQRLGMKRKRPG